MTTSAHAGRAAEAERYATWTRLGRQPAPGAHGPAGSAFVVQPGYRIDSSDSARCAGTCSTNSRSNSFALITTFVGPPSALMISGTVLECPTTSTHFPAALI